MGGEASLLLVWLEGALRYLLGGGGLRLVTVPWEEGKDEAGRAEGETMRYSRAFRPLQDDF